MEGKSDLKEGLSHREKFDGKNDKRFDGSKVNQKPLQPAETHGSGAQKVTIK